MLILDPHIGQIIRLTPSVNIDKNGFVDNKPVPAKIVYINLPHRYFTAEFTYPSGSIRESYKFCRQGDLASCLKH